ncbi:CoA ester lyase [Pusillimonas sp. MFBS29]|uniref:HpcH/HpaI aldolase/citrate lyase family protein n=1 Tax=Pusillimonas sp. MFBS29 TaxID=2886690 RepID=UPI001D117544|nr:CoA ester lyase [Pusillimonas sp. MFBS29]MCC2597184.1 CoA ester lyase [Pusillimonas sp. MFBS29]
MSGTERSLLFVPGDRPDRFDKAVASGAHQVVLDLEDAVAPASKDQARTMVREWLAAGNQAAVRINAVDTPWHEDDLQMLKAFPSAVVMLAKADDISLARASDALPGHQFIALLETVAGYVKLSELCAVTGLKRIAFGSIDFSVDSGIADEGEALTAVRTQIVLASRYAGLAAPIDGVSTEFTDEQCMRADALRSRSLGFGGKLCIHPRQTAAVNNAYLPTAEEVDWARRVLQAFESSGGGATALDGKMIDKPVVDHARQVLADNERRGKA